MILCEFDESKEAIINPWDLVRKEVRVKGEMPKIAVCCFEGKMFYRLVELLNGELIAVTKMQMAKNQYIKLHIKEKKLHLLC